jgi:branched-chain amino acid transport system permease protein
MARVQARDTQAALALRPAARRWTLFAGWAGLVVAGVALLAYPHVVSRFQISLATEAVYLAVWALSLHLMLGYLGMLSFGHAAYIGLGAYTVALLLRKTDIPFGAAFLLAPVVSAVVAAVVGAFCIRLRHQVYFAMLTLAFAQIVYTVTFQWYSFTGGDNGVIGFGRNIPAGLRTNPTNLYYFSMAVGLVCLALIWLIVRSPFGVMLRTIRENAERAEAIGVPVQWVRFLTFVLAGAFAGVAGALLATFQRAVFPDTLHWSRSGEVIIMVLLGGMNHFLGPVVGAAAFLFLNKYSTQFTQYWQLLIGLVLLAIVLVFRGGILGFLEDAWRAAARRAGRAMNGRIAPPGEPVSTASAREEPS